MRGMEGEMLKGHLDMIVLAALAAGPAHGYAVIEEIKRRSGQKFNLPEGTVYPALHRLERRGWIKARWGTSENNRKAKFYELTKAGRRQLEIEQDAWQKLTAAVSQILETA